MLCHGPITRSPIARLPSVRPPAAGPNQVPAAGVLTLGMHELVGRLASPLVGVGEDLTTEFEARLADSGTLAVRVAYGVLRNRADAEDVAQEAFVRAFRRFADLRDRGKFRGWLVRMTWRLALDFRRGGKRRTAREDGAARSWPATGDAEADMVATDRSKRLWAAIDQLPERLRVVIVLA